MLQPRQAGFRLLGVMRALSCTGYYAFAPFLGIWAAGQGLSPRRVSLMVGVFVFFARAGGLLCLPLVRQTGVGQATRGAYLLAALVLGLLAVAAGAGQELLCVILLAILGLLFAGATMAIKALVAQESEEGQRLVGFSALNVADNLGAAIGPILGGVLIAHAALYPAALPLGVSIVVVLAGTLALWVRPTEVLQAAVDEERAEAAATGLALPLRLLAFLVLSSATYVGYAQVFSVLPMTANLQRVDHIVQWLYMLNAAMIIGGQELVARWLTQWKAGNESMSAKLMATANLLMAFGLALFALAPVAGWWVGFVAMTFFTAAELIWSPVYNASLPNLVPQGKALLAYGCSGMVWGLAESLGAAIGTFLVVALQSSAAPFLLGTLSACIAGSFFWLHGRSLNLPARS